MPYPVPQKRVASLSCAALAMGLALGCGEAEKPWTGGTAGTPLPASDYSSYGEVTPADIKFLDAPTTNAAVEIELRDLPLVTTRGDETTLRTLVGDKPCVLVFTKGWTGSICPYCSTQVSSLITKFAEIRKRNAAVVVVYPIENGEQREKLEGFLGRVRQFAEKPADAELPFPVVFDLGLKAVDQLGIRQYLSKPATYVLDSAGEVRFAYVGSSLADRPSVKAILAQLDLLRLQK